MWSNPIAYTTAAVPPSSPTQLTVVAATQGSATLSWSLPEDSGGGRVSVYEVSLLCEWKAPRGRLSSEEGLWAELN